MKHRKTYTERGLGYTMFMNNIIEMGLIIYIRDSFTWMYLKKKTVW